MEPRLWPQLKQIVQQGTDDYSTMALHNDTLAHWSSDLLTL